MANRNTYVTAHNLETGESKTFAPDEELPSWAEKSITNPDVYDTPEEDQAPVPGPSQGEDLIGTSAGGEDDPLMSNTKADLLATAEEYGVEDVSDSNTKAEIVAALRAAGYDGE